MQEWMASPLDNCDDRAALHDEGQAVSAAGIIGSWTVEKRAGLSAAGLKSPSSAASKPLSSRRERSLTRQHGPTYRSFRLLVTALCGRNGSAFFSVQHSALVRFGGWRVGCSGGEGHWWVRYRYDDY